VKLPAIVLVVALVALAGQLACGGGGTAAPDADETCTGFADWRTSAYVLPYTVGAAFRVLQGNCSASGNGHRGANRYGYDFDMPIGTAVRAAREGDVIQVEESHQDGQVAATGLDNYVVVRHADGTAALYGHLTHDGALVAVGDAVRQGHLIAQSGNTGNTGNVPHLHFSVQACDPVAGGSTGCPTLPATFRNTEANPQGLEVGRSYVALPF
jgi:murein DD-endopeptidase MepM/ murein hydrolase activator NlpD